MLLNGLNITGTRPVLIAGPTASGKSSLAINIAKATGGTVVNADALQVYDCWRVLSARPSPDEEAQCPHALYGHLPYDAAYSAGQWLRDVQKLDVQGPLIVTGGTGLYFRALTEGLSDIPDIVPEVRERAMQGDLELMLAELDQKTLSRIDGKNPRRVQRAWEVLTSTGTGLADWHDNTPAPLIPLDQADAIVLETDVEWLNDRISRRFEIMMSQGALDEVRQIQTVWRDTLPAAQAIGAPELMAHLNGQLNLEEAIERAVISSRQYAKRQRTWFRARMKSWTKLDPRDFA